MADWIVDKKGKRATLPIFGGELAVFRAANGKCEALWVRDDAPAETRAFHLAVAQKRLAEAAGADPQPGPALIALLQSNVYALKASRADIRDAGRLEVTAFIHVYGDQIVTAMNSAPAVIRGSLRQTHPELFSQIATEPQPAPFTGSEPF